MAYCGPRGIPHSHFLGGPALWTEADRDKAIWWSIHEAQKCPRCGTREEEWDPQRGGSIHAYHAVEHKCWGCVAKDGAEKKLERDPAPGLSVRLVRNPEVLGG